MKFTVDKQVQYAVITLEEENLNSLIAPDLKSEFVIFHNEGIRNIILDLCKVKYVDSSGLSAILTGNRLWKNHGSFLLTGIVDLNVKKLFEISRLDTILVMIPTLAESVDYVIMEEVERELSNE
ncbi:MAG: STAS domain-containing protein [Saprospiraceae bacterium]